MRKAIGSITFSLMIHGVSAAPEAADLAGKAPPRSEQAADLNWTTTTNTTTGATADCPTCSDKAKPNAGDQTKAAPKPSNARAADQPAPAKPVIYVPPSRGKPAGRVGGGTRGSGRQEYELHVLAPDHVGLSVDPQPSLFWFNAREIGMPVDLVITDLRGARDARYSTPIVEVRMPPPVRPGIHCLRLREHALSAGVSYEWSVAVVADPERRSSDRAQSFGGIELAERSADLEEELAGATVTEVPAVYGKRGLWYDLVAALARAVEQTPDDNPLRAEIGPFMAKWTGVAIRAEELAGLECLEDKLEVDAAILEITP